MPPAEQPRLANRLLSRLSSEDFALLADLLTPLDCPRAMVICEPDQPIPFVLFPEAGIVSVVVLAPDGQQVEGGLIGREGFAPTAVVLGVDRIPHRLEIQVAGHGHSIVVADFLAAVARSESLRAAMLHFTHCLAVQTACTALSNAVHPVDERLARWLLMCHDRSDTNDIKLTHKFMAVMLAVRRASVTTSLQVLEGNRLIRADRGYVTIVNRAELEEFAGEGYGQPEAEYRRLLGPL